VTECKRIFIDTSKHVFQLHGVDAAEQPVLRRKLRRSEMIAFFAKLPPTLVGLEACGASHHWARELKRLGHEVRLVPPQHVKPYLNRNKNDARDAEAGCEAMSRPRTRFVAVKSQEDQAGLMLVTVRDRLVRTRTQLGNAIRGHAAEFGLVTPKGTDKIGPLIARIAQEARLPELALDLFSGLGTEYVHLEEKIAAIERRLLAFHRRNEASLRLAGIPAVGPVGAVMLTRLTPDPRAFASGRDFAAWLGLTPKDHSTAGRQRLGGITRAGDEALRAVLVSGAMSLLTHCRRSGRRPWPWLDALMAKPPKLAAVALANRIARIAWKLMVSGEAYDPARAQPARAQPARAKAAAVKTAA
jgi:transposase